MNLTLFREAAPKNSTAIAVRAVDQLLRCVRSFPASSRWGIAAQNKLTDCWTKAWRRTAAFLKAEPWWQQWFRHHDLVTTWRSNQGAPAWFLHAGLQQNEGNEEITLVANTWQFKQLWPLSPDSQTWLENELIMHLSHELVHVQQWAISKGRMVIPLDTPAKELASPHEIEARSLDLLHEFQLAGGTKPHQLDGLLNHLPTWRGYVRVLGGQHKALKRLLKRTSQRMN